MDLKLALLDLLERAYHAEQAFVAGLREEERAALGAPDAWSAKDVVAHVGAWKGRMASDLLAVLRGAADSAPDIDAVNRSIYDEYQARPWEDVLAMTDANYRALVDAVQAMDEAGLRHDPALPGEARQPVWRRVALGGGFGHPLAHLIEYHSRRGQGERAAGLTETLYHLLLPLDDSPDYRGTLLYNRACARALAGRQAGAVSELREAFRLRPDLVEWSKTDSDLDSLRGDAEYRALVEEG
jgi:hypothetical protein